MACVIPAATILISQGVDIKAVSARLGHARTSTTVDIYAKALSEAQTEFVQMYG
jgi:integrase